MGEPYRFPFALVVVMPTVQVGTAEAYSLVRPDSLNRPDLRAAVLSNDLERWRRELINDFEEPILARYPVIRQALQMLLTAGADYAALSGSGAAVFGVFEREEDARAAAEEATAAGLAAWSGGSRRSGHLAVECRGEPDAVGVVVGVRVFPVVRALDDAVRGPSVLGRSL